MIARDAAVEDCEEHMEGVRTDVWLWAARFYKTRALAKKACELGRVESQGHSVKPAREIHVGDMLGITTEGGLFEVEVLGLSEMRGPAPIARTLYKETEASVIARQKAAEERKSMMFFEPAPVGRPSKKDRRKIIQFRGRGRNV